MHRPDRSRRLVRAAASGAAIALLALAPAWAATTITSTPSQPNGWSLGGTAAIVTSQPAGGLGLGAVRAESITDPADTSLGRGFVATALAPVRGTRLEDLQQIDYRVAVAQYPPASPFLTATVFLWLALDGDLANEGTVGATTQQNKVVIAYEPCYDPAIGCVNEIQPLNTWTTWSATPASKAWWPASDIGSNAAATIYDTLDAVVLGQFPAAAIERMRVQVGQGGGGAPWEGWVGYLDGVRFVSTGAAATDETVDFEPDPVPPSPTPTPTPTVAPSVQPTATSPAQLPDSGAPDLGIAAAGLALVTVGAAFVIVARRRA